MIYTWNQLDSVKFRFWDDLVGIHFQFDPAGYLDRGKVQILEGHLDLGSPNSISEQRSKYLEVCNYLYLLASLRDSEPETSCSIWLKPLVHGKRPSKQSRQMCSSQTMVYRLRTSLTNNAPIKPFLISLLAITPC